MEIIEVVGAAIKDGDRILAAQRSAVMKLPFKWEFAGGKVEEYESHQQALERELLEELGVRIKTGDFIARGVSKEPQREIHLYVYLAEIIQGEPEAKEHNRIEWVELDDLMKLDWAEADIPACEELIRRFSQEHE